MSDLPVSVTWLQCLGLSKAHSEAVVAAHREEVDAARTHTIVTRSYQQVIKPLDMTITLDYATREAFEDAVSVVHAVNAARTP